MKSLHTLFPLTVLLLTLFQSQAFAQKSSPDDYNLKKAYEVLKENKDEDKALELLTEQLKATPNNSEALLLRARVYRNKENLGLALSDINQAIKFNKPSKSGIAMSTLYWWRATIYSDLTEQEKCVNDYKTARELARKDNKENLQQISFDYAQALFDLGKLDEADAVYNQMIKEDETDQAAMVGKARNMIERKEFEKAVKLLLDAQKYDTDYSSNYKFLMRAYNELGETEKAIDSGITYCDKDHDAYVAPVLDIMKKNFNYSVAKVRAQIKKSENTIYWKAFLCMLYEEHYDFELAIKVYDEIEKDNGKDAWIYSHRADCYDELGLSDKAIQEISLAMEKEKDFYSLLTRGDYYRKAGKYEEAIADFSAAIEEAPDHSFGYYRRGWCYELSGDNDKAMEDYNLGIDIDKDYPYLYLMRAEQYLMRGEKEKANEDLNMILQKDTTADGSSCRQYALHFLGKDDEAIEWMNKIIEADPDEKGNYYDQACLLTRIGIYDEAVAALKKCLDLGYRSFGHIEHDDDLDGIRNREDFKEAIAEAKEKVRILLEKNQIENPYVEPKTIEIAISKRSGGTFEIPCNINGLPLQMLFDTGASDVTISSVEANFMLKNDYLSQKDIKGKKYYQIANGDLSEGTVITLKEVKIGDAVLRNVDASVVKNQHAPLLLGQSVLERFGTITIDNINSKLIIKQ